MQDLQPDARKLGHALYTLLCPMHPWQRMNGVHVVTIPSVVFSSSVCHILILQLDLRPRPPTLLLQTLFLSLPLTANATRTLNPIHLQLAPRSLMKEGAMRFWR